MKKAKFLILPIAAAALTLTACSNKEVNHGPELWGTNDITCLAGATVDLLDGVAALDLEDGDITPDMKITVTPEVEVENGYAVFAEAGAYEVCYEVRDSQGKYARTTVDATVTEREVYMDNAMTNGFSLKTGGGVKVLNNGLNGSVYSFKVTGNEIAEDVKLSRSYTLITGEEYTFEYYFNCNLAGRIKIAANGKSIAERQITAGENKLQFTYTLPYAEAADGEAAHDTAEIELWLGGLDGDLEVSLSKSVATRYQHGDLLTDKIADFDFNDHILGRFDGSEGNVGTVENGKGVYLEMTKAGSADWCGGVFVNTGLTVSEGDTYVISYDVEARDANPFFVKFQNKQWDEKEIAFKDQTGPVSFETTITSENQGSLWIYIASGNYLNKITLKNLSVKLKFADGQPITQTFAIGQVYSSNYGGGAGSAKCEYGKIIYDVQTFGNEWGQNELGTPSFALSGAAGNYVITFKAKASSPVSCVFAASVADYWDTFVWKQLKLTTEEQIFSIRCDDKAVEGQYKFLWQFGTYANTAYTDVTVEISDVKICLLSELEN